VSCVYRNGERVHLGDRVQAGPSGGSEWLGEVVFVVSPPAFSPEFPEAETGFMVRFSDGKLIHYPVSDPDLSLVARAA